MDLEKIRQGLSKDLNSIGYHLYSLNYIKKDKILEVLIDETLDLDHISKLSEDVSKFMDKYDDEMDEYLLDVASAGAERIIKGNDEILKAIGNYIHVKTDEFESDGTLIEFKDEVLKIEYLDKTRKKIKELNVKDVKQLRYAIKF